MLRRLFKLIKSILLSKDGVFKRRSRTYKELVYDKAHRLGDEGELKVSNFLGTLNGKVLNNVLLPKEHGYCQIDHIFITGTCVYVIETKNHSGEVRGNKTDDSWVVKYPNGKEYDMYNPIKQNEKHVDAVKRCLGDVTVESLVVFANDNCKLDTNIRGLFLFGAFEAYMYYRVNKLGDTSLRESQAQNINIKQAYKMLKKADKSNDKEVVERHLKIAKKMQYSNK